MLSTLSNMLFGNGVTDDAAVDQTLASQPTPLDMQDTENGWVLVDVADDESSSVPENQPVQVVEQSFVQLEQTSVEDETFVQLERERTSVEEDDEQAENRPVERRAANTVQPRNQCNAEAVQVQCAKLARYKQRQQQAAISKDFNRKHLKMCDKARIVQTSGRKAASARNRVLRPSGRMNGRHCQHKF